MNLSVICHPHNHLDSTYNERRFGTDVYGIKQPGIVIS
jgi:hypothetical protein